jgi:hypothetical protein
MLGGPVIGSALAGAAMVALSDHLVLAIAGASLLYVTSLIVFEWRMYPEDARTVWELVPRLGNGPMSEGGSGFSP